MLGMRPAYPPLLTVLLTKLAVNLTSFASLLRCPQCESSFAVLIEW